MSQHLKRCNQSSCCCFMIFINAILNSRLFDHWLFHIYYNIVVSSSGVVSCPLVPDPESFSSLYYSFACSTNRIVIYSPGGFNCCWTTATRPKKTNGAFCSAFISSLNCTVDGVGKEASETIHRSASNYCIFILPCLSVSDVSTQNCPETATILASHCLCVCRSFGRSLLSSSLVYVGEN